VSRARIGTLRLRIPAGNRRFATALATAVASRLARRVGERGAEADGLKHPVHVTAPRSMQVVTWAGSIVDGITGGERPRKGGR
jgi:hypothetical protein